MMIENLLREKKINFQRLCKSEGIIISQKWLSHFAKNIKEQTGKYLVGKYKWEAYWTNIEHAVSDSEALRQYIQSETGDFYVIGESGKEVYLCSSSEWPSFYKDYVVPQNFAWSMAFSHEGSCHFAISDT